MSGSVNQIPVELATTAAARIAAIRSYLQAFVGARPVGVDHAEFSFILSIVKAHPRAAEKLAHGVRAFEVRCDWRGNVALFLHDTRGQEVDVSWRKCATGADFTEDGRVRRAMRRAIVGQVGRALRAWALAPAPCGICGQDMIDADVHVDHITPFHDIANAFLGTRTDIPPTFDEDPTTHQVCFRESDADFARAWELYHEAHADLRVTHARCNLTRFRTTAA